METNTVQISPAPAALQFMPVASGHTVLLATEEFPMYHAHITRFLTELRPDDARECELVQRMADTEWRLNRIARLEMGIFAQGQVEFAGLFATVDANVRQLLIESHTYTTYSRQLNNLSLQEARLRRYFQVDSDELNGLQLKRAQRDVETPGTPAFAPEIAKTASVHASSGLAANALSEPAASNQQGASLSHPRSKADAAAAGSANTRTSGWRHRTA